jgi:hypothetical protein
MPFSKFFKKLKIEPQNKGYGEYARLFPALSEKGKEGRAASIFLACLARIPELADEILSPLGRSVGKRSSVVCLTEVAFPKMSVERPDGLIAVKTGNDFWGCLTEFKVGSPLETNQIEGYLKLARQHGLNAVLTISNDIVPMPSKSPVKVNGQLTKSIGLFHISWKSILTSVQLLIAKNKVQDSDHEMLLREFVRFLVHPSTGITGYTQMPTAWNEIVEAARDRKTMKKNDGSVVSVVEGWMQEERELAFILSENTGSFTEVLRNREENKNVDKIFDNHTKNLIDHNLLTTEIIVEEAASPIGIELDLQSRSIRISMELKAPQDKTQARASATWLTRQFKSKETIGIHVEADWSGRQKLTSCTLNDIIEDPNNINPEENTGTPTKFRLIMKHELQRRFSSRKNIILELEKQTEEFYRLVGQHVSAFVPNAPKSRDKTTAEKIVESATLSDE